MATVPSKASSAKVVSAYLQAHVQGGTIGGGQLYAALFMLLNVAKGNTIAHEGNLVSCFVAGKLAAVASLSKAGVITKLVDAAGNDLAVGQLKVEQALAWARLGKVPSKVQPLVLGKAPRLLIAAGKLPEGWAP